MPNDSESTLGRKVAPVRKARIFVGLSVLLAGLPPLINALGDPGVATLHRPDVIKLLASGLCFGFGLALLISRLIFRGE